MIVVDTSVWIDYLNGDINQKVIALRSLIGRQPILVGDIILCEVLQGLQSEREARAVEAALRRFEIVSMLNSRLAVEAAAHFRTLRARGITVRKTIDLIIGTFCIANDCTLLHDDRDFNPMGHYLGLRMM